MFLPNLGIGLIWTGLAAVIVAIVMYLVGLRQRRSAGLADATTPLAQRIGRGAFFVAVACVLGTSVIHSTLLMTHRFDINYVYRFSARGLPTQYLFATFWAGQEGSFLLWAFWTSVLGVILALTSGRKVEGRVMPIYGCVLAFLLVLLAVKSPFAPYAPTGPNDPIGTPTDGVGLNPLLENYWMVIHPPTLFLGFASLAATFAFAVQALIWGEFDGWIRRTWPWALFSFAVLGFGVMLGGYWAYETLGWGGFWGWDPVENGPLVPWLAMTAYLHGAQTQHARGSLKRTTLFLGILPFVTALYETFLTRTGILGSFSVHSFSTLGGVANSVILYGMLFAIAVSFGLLLWRSGRIKSETNALDDGTSRDFGMTIAIALLMACALITGVGMSAPLITQAGVTLHIVKAQSSVQPDFYNKANFPIACLLLLGMAVGPYLTWRKTVSKQIEPVLWAYVAAVCADVAFFVVGRYVLHIDTPVKLLLALIIMFTLCAMCIFANVRMLSVIRIGSGPSAAAAGLRTAGGAIAHIGAAMLLLGVVFLVAWYRQEDQMLVQGHSQEVNSLPMTLTYIGSTSTLSDPTNKLKIDVLERATGGNSGAQLHYVAYMPCALRNVDGVEELVARPAIVHRWWGDLYFSFKGGPDQVSPTPLLWGTLHEGEVAKIAGYTIACGNFSADPQAAAMARQGIIPDKFPVTIPLTITTPSGSTSEIDAQFITFRNNPIGDSSPEVPLPISKDKIPWALAVSGLNADQGSAKFYIRDSGVAPIASYTIEVSTRPMIGMVWIGTILIALGGLISMRRRVLENRLVPIPEPEEGFNDGSAGRVASPDRHARNHGQARHRTSPAQAKGGN